MEQFITIYDYYIENNLTNVIAVTKFKCGCEMHTNYKDGWNKRKIFDTFEEEIKHAYGFVFTIEYEIKIENDTLYVYDNIDDYCLECKAKACYCDEEIPPIGFDMVTKYHGLNAFYCDGSYDNIINNFEEIANNPQYQICCSTDLIGDIGVIVAGDTLMASNHDLNTKIDKTNNRRYYNKTNLNDKYIIHDAKDLKDNLEGNNNELIVTNIKITAIWITNKAKEESIKAAMYLAKKYNLKIITLTHMFK